MEKSSREDRKELSINQARIQSRCWETGGDESWAAQDLEVEGVGILDQFWQAFHVAGCHSSG
jgi:hypothetical protein